MDWTQVASQTSAVILACYGLVKAIAGLIRLFSTKKDA